MRGLLAIAAGAFVAPRARWVALVAILTLAPAWAAAGGPAVVDAPGFGPVMSMRPAGPGVIQGGGWSLACLFSSTTGATCSDSRTVTTTRSTAVPCQQADGTWGTAGVDEACIAPGGVPGVESYGPVTNYVVNSTSPALWTAAETPTVTGNLVTDDSATLSEGVYLNTGRTATGSKTFACYLRAGTLTTARLAINPSGTGTGLTTCNVSGLTSASTRQTCTATVGGTPTYMNAVVYVGASNVDTGSIYIDQCQFEDAPTPGRRCDSGGTATTCGADGHSVSTTGWPTTNGEIEIAYNPANATDSGSRVLLGGRSNSVGGFTLYVGSSTGAIAVDWAFAGGNSFPTSGALTWTPSQPYRIKVVWRGSSLIVYRDGVTVMSQATGGTLGPWSATAFIGSTNGSVGHANGTVSVLYVGEPR